MIPYEVENGKLTAYLCSDDCYYNNGGYCEYFDQEIIGSSGNECPIDGEEINSDYKESDK